MSLLTLDTHVDIRWPEPPDPLGETTQQVDFPKMARGGMRGTVFIAYVPQGKRDEAGHGAAAARAEAMLRHIRARADGEARRFCATPAELEACHAAGAPRRALSGGEWLCHGARPLGAGALAGARRLLPDPDA